MPSVGIDVEQVSKIERVLARNSRFAQKCFCPAERDYCDRMRSPVRHYAARFCAKEAFAKAIGQPLRWHDVEVVRSQTGKPGILARGAAAELLAGRNVEVSISHGGDYAVAVVIIE